MLQTFGSLVTLFGFLRGYKTYIAGAGMIMIGLGGWLINCLMPAIDSTTALDFAALASLWNDSAPYLGKITEGLAVIGFRDYMTRTKI